MLIQDLTTLNIGDLLMAFDRRMFALWLLQEVIIGVAFNGYCLFLNKTVLTVIKRLADDCVRFLLFQAVSGVLIQLLQSKSRHLVVC